MTQRKNFLISGTKKMRYIGRSVEPQLPQKTKGYSDEYSVSPSLSRNSATMKSDSECTDQTITRPIDSDSSNDNSSIDRKVNIDLTEYAKIIDSLLPYSKTQINKLSTSSKEKLHVVQHLALSADCKQQNEIKDILRSKFSFLLASNEVEPHTVGAVFVGCMLKGCSGVPMGCSPNCAGSISLDENESKFVPCNDSVYYIKENVPRLLTHGMKNNGQAYVYAESKFKGFDNTHYNFFKNEGVNHILLFIMDRNGVWKKITHDFTPLINLIKMESDNMLNLPNIKNGWMSNVNMWWVLLILFALILILWMCYYWKGQNKWQKQKLVMMQTMSDGHNLNEQYNLGDLSNDIEESMESEDVQSNSKMDMFIARSGFSPSVRSGKY